jgi:hypothetical protein
LGVLLQKTAPIEVPTSNGCQVDAIQTTSIDCDRVFPRWGNTFTEWGTSAFRAEMVFDSMLVERVDDRIIFGREQAKAFSRDKPVK